MRILVNYDGHSDQGITAAFTFLGSKISELIIHTTIPYVPYCSVLEICIYDPSYAEQIDRAYYAEKVNEKQRKLLLENPGLSIKTLISRGYPDIRILKACKENDPDLVVLDHGHRGFNILNNEWGLVRRRCEVPLLEVKRRSRNEWE